jgi:hypothetical protein
LLFVHANGITLVVSTWLIHYLAEGTDGMGGSPAGLPGFVLFAATTVMRPVGGRLAGSGFSATVLAGLSPLLAAAGLVGIGLDRSFAVAILWICSWTAASPCPTPP